MGYFRAVLRRTGRLAIAGAVLGSTTIALHAADIAGSSDHPLVGRFEGSSIVGYQVSEYDEAAVIDGRFSPLSTDTRAGQGFRTLEGRIVLIYYALPEGRSTLQVLRNYERSLRAKGFSMLFACASADGSCFETDRPEGGYLLGQAVGDPHALPRLMTDYVHNWFAQGRYLLARLDRPEGAVYASLTLGESARGNVAIVRVIETKEMETDKIVFVTAAEMQQSIGQTGKVALRGIQFEAKSERIVPASQPTLDEIAKLLASKPELKLKVVAHGDEAATTEPDRALASRRAQSIVGALIGAHGIAPDRLVAGIAASSDSNNSESGANKNRSVELVAQ
jgi:outer membrane protein OmpA-like peptidoglycan-associated protein